VEFCPSVSLRVHVAKHSSLGVLGVARFVDQRDELALNDRLTQNQTPPALPSAPVGGFAEDYHHAVGGLRRALRTLLVGAGGDPSRPQTVARGFGLDKNLAWKVSRLVEATDDVEALRFLPGPAGRRMLCEAIGARATDQARIEVENALSLFDSMVHRHAGDRATLDVLAQCLDPAHAQDEVLQQHRKQAFLGNRATWGAQACTQIVAQVVAPGRDSDSPLEALELGGLLGFRRIRGDVRWRLLDRPADAVDGKPALEPLVPPPSNAEGAPLLPDFCTRPLPDMAVHRNGDDVRYLLREGDVGIAGELDCVYGLKATYAGAAAAQGPTLRVPLTTPVEDLEVAVLVHRDLATDRAPVIEITGLLNGTSTGLDPLVPTSVESVEGGLAKLEVKQAPQLGKLLAGAIETAGWRADEFRVWRFSLPFPPIPAAATLTTGVALGVKV